MSDTQVKNSIFLMAGRAIVLAVSVITPVVLVRCFSVGEYGQYRQAMLIITTAGSIISLGMPNSLYYFFPHFPSEKGSYLSRTIVVTFLSGLLFCLLMWAGAGEIAIFFRDPRYLETSLLVGMTTFMFAFSSLLDTALLADGEVKLSAKIMSGGKILQAPVLIACALTGGVYLLLVGFLCSLVCKSLVSLVIFRKRYRISLRGLKLADSLPHLSYAVPLGMGGIFAMLSESADKFMVSHLLGEKAFALYSTGCYELPFIIVIFGSIGDVMLPVVVRLKSMQQNEAVAQAWHKAIEQSMLIGIPVFVFFFAYAGEFITTVFTAKYLEAVPIFRVSLITVLLESLRYGMITRAYARTGFMLVASMVAFCLMLVASYFGIRHFGMMGAIVSFVSARCLIVGSEIAYSKYILSLRWRRLLPFGYMARILGISLSCLLLPLALRSFYVSGSDLLQLCYLMAFSFSSFAYLTNITGFWSAEVLPVPLPVKRWLQYLFPGKRGDVSA